MNTVIHVRFTALLAVIVLLQGCAAAAVVRKQPDFDNEQRQRLMQAFPPAQVAVAEQAVLIPAE